MTIIMLKINSKAPSFVIPSTSKDKYSLKKNLLLLKNNQYSLKHV